MDSYVGSALTNQEGARALAKKIFDIYDKDKSGVIEAYEVGTMMVDAYKSINKAFTPSKYDLDTLLKVLDRDGDGKVTLNDVEGLVIKLMCGER
jgi:Ca2+-binding EF-hand superfamily protein